MRVRFCVFRLSIHRRSPPPPPYTLQTIVLLLLFFTSSIFLTQVDLLLITSTFTQIQMQSNLGTTDVHHEQTFHRTLLQVSNYIFL